MTIRVVLADDHPMYRYGLTAILNQAEAIEVVASVGDGAALMAAVSEHSPDVVVTDLSMPDLDGVTATTQLLLTQPDLAILVITMREDDEHVFAALRAGARGYLVKGADGEEIVRAVRSVASGEAVYGGTVARRIVAFYSGRQAESPAARAFPDLTPREREVLELLATGCRNHEIARRLGMSEKTVRNHVFGRGSGQRGPVLRQVQVEAAAPATDAHGSACPPVGASADERISSAAVAPASVGFRPGPDDVEFAMSRLSRGVRHSNGGLGIRQVRARRPHLRTRANHRRRTRRWPPHSGLDRWCRRALDRLEDRGHHPP